MLEWPARAASGSSQPTYSSTRLHVETIVASLMRGRACQRGQRTVEAATGGEIQPFAQLDWRGAMTDADQKQLHA